MVPVADVQGAGPVPACTRPVCQRLHIWKTALTVLALAAIPASPSAVSAQAGDDKNAGAAAEPRAVPEALNFANALLREKHYAQAAEEYERFLKDVPTGLDAAEAHFGLGRARLFLHKFREARYHFEEFLKLAPEHPNAATAQFRIGEMAYMLGDLPAARKALDTYTQAHPGHSYLETAWPYLGDVDFQLGDLPAARRAYQEALNNYPEGREAARARYGLAQTLAAQGEVDPALKLFNELARRNLPSWSDRAQYQAGRVLAGAGRFAEALHAFETLEKAFPRSEIVPEARVRRAEALTHLDRHEEAEVLLQPLRNDPSAAVAIEAAYVLGGSLLDRGKPAEARAVFDAALAKFPSSPRVPALLFRSAEAAQKENKLDLARARYLKVVDLAPQDPWADDALRRAAGLALDAKDYAAARAMAANLTTKYPQSPLLSDAHLIEARAVLALGQPKNAIKLLNEVLADDRPSPETAQVARYYLGQAYRADGQEEKANEILESLASTPAAPVATDAQFLVGQTHFLAGRYTEAIPAFQKYLAGKPKGEVADHALAYLAAAQLETGKPDEAAETLEQLATQFPKSKVLPPTLLRLAESAMSAKQWERAAALYRRAEDADDAKLKVRALSGLGWALIEGGQAAEAAKALAARLKVSSDDAQAPQDALALGRALEQAGQTDQALAAYEQVTERYAKSKEASQALLAQARLLVEAKRPADAARAYSIYVQALPKSQANPNAPVRSEDRPDGVLAEWGWALLDAGKTADADRVFARLLAQFPDSPKAADARLNLAESAYQAKNYEEVARLLEPVVTETSKADPLVIQSALYRLGRTGVARKDWSGAARYFDRLVATYADGPYVREARFWRAEVAFQADDPKTAEPLFAALASEPPAPGTESWIQTARLRRVQSLILLERWKDALKQADALKTEAPEHPQMAEIDYARGRALQGLAQFDEARTAYQAVIDARKGGDLAARAQFMRGETYFHQKRYDEALRELLKVDVLYKAPPWQAAALLEAGKIYQELAQWTEAAEIYKKLRDKFPDSPNAAEATRRLTEVERQASTRQQDAPGTTDTASRRDD